MEIPDICGIIIACERINGTNSGLCTIDSSISGIFIFNIQDLFVAGIHLPGRRYYGKINFSSNGNTHRITPGSNKITFVVLVHNNNIYGIGLALRITGYRDFIPAVYRTSRGEITNIDTAVSGNDGTVAVPDDFYYRFGSILKAGIFNFHIDVSLGTNVQVFRHCGNYID